MQYQKTRIWYQHHLAIGVIPKYITMIRAPVVDIGTQYAAAVWPTQKNRKTLIQTIPVNKFQCMTNLSLKKKSGVLIANIGILHMGLL